ncbi:hypothetical protein [Nocardioides currus]|uniref:Lipoprotein n=1 Tax=Nocardioides currus TaxID=2133958 RepID=A0A2R7Z1N0_9ACTN|nr:hypothetical protein [Nocardioides currus]PUA82474.1 hypothetical protein C7S10_01625 [Nocardioides currus]
MSVRRALAVALLVPLVLLSACTNDDPEPKMPETSSSTPSPTESSSTAAPETPEAFIRRWAALEAEMERSGDTTAYLQLQKGCSACTDLARTVDGYYKAGGFVRWAGWTIGSVRAYPPGGEGAYAVKVSSPPTEYKESKGGALKTLPGGRSTKIITLAPAGDSWVVTDKAELA